MCEKKQCVISYIRYMSRGNRFINNSPEWLTYLVSGLFVFGLVAAILRAIVLAIIN
jgi:hypothetical protein